MGLITDIKPVPYPASENGTYLRVLLTSTSLSKDDKNFRHALRFIRDVYGEPTIFHAAGQFQDPGFRTSRFWTSNEAFAEDPEKLPRAETLHDLNDRGWLLPDDPIEACNHMWRFARPQLLLSVNQTPFARYLGFIAMENTVPIITFERHCEMRESLSRS
ncbi:MAG TPA: hypothetical protein PKE16_09485 [Hyphomicrobium sp.]|nr:hypothetical protein [Hyphomicrobium sp.]